MSELFLRGDPRFLSGGARVTTSTDYEFDPDHIEEFSGGVVTSDKLASDTVLDQAVRQTGQDVHRGRSAYHRKPPLNVFISRDDELPTVGVELETVLKSSAVDETNRVARALISNWFHFETDSSLGDNGWECITEPLPSRIYRDPRTWLGLQNVLCPWAGSWTSSCTGLHVHVGLDLFRQPKAIPFSIPDHNKRLLGKTVVAYVYFMLADPVFSDSVFMRPQSHYCGSGEGKANVLRSMFPAPGTASHDDIVRAAFNRLFIDPSNHIDNPCSVSASTVASLDVLSSIRHAWHDKDLLLLYSPPFNMAGHDIELNLSHGHTAEFRRGKGTLNGLTVHRMVDYASLMVRYAMDIVNPTRDFLPSRRDFYSFIAEKTASASLRRMAEVELEKTKCA